MRDVTLVEVHADGEHLVLTDESGQRYRLGIDDQLRAAVRKDVAWLNRLRSGGEQSLRPRDIQIRIRGGMSAEEIAEATGMSLEHVRRYEGPVLAERAHVAERAQKVAVTRSSRGDTSLADSVAEQLALRGAPPQTLWDSWREDAGTWIVQVGFSAAGRARTAQWRYHAGDATLEPLDDESRWLTVTPEPERTAPGVTERVYDVSGGTLREHEHTDEPATSGQSASPEAEADPDDPQARTLDLLDALRGRRGRRQASPGATPEEPDLVDALLAEDELPPPAHPPASRPEEAVDAEILSLREPRPADADADSQEQPEQDKDTRPATPPRRNNRKRSTVPSWDDIMFGTKRD